MSAHRSQDERVAILDPGSREPRCVPGGPRFCISVIGTGYLGAVHAACLAGAGHRVVGVDTDAQRIEALRSGRAPFHEPGLDALLRKTLRNGDLSFSDDIAAVTESDIHFLCVGTPQRESGEADLHFVDEAMSALIPHLHDGCLVVGKSTVPVGTAARLAARLVDETPADVDVRLAWNPEFLREGHAVEDTLRPDRLVFGVSDESANQTLRLLYASVVPSGTPVVRTDLATAELAKVSANVMLAARLSVVNTLGEVCESADANVADLTTILGYDARIGADYLSPGLGFGGGCLPKDLRAFVARAAELGVDQPLELLRQVDRVNGHQRDRLVALADEAVEGPVADARIAVLGTAFKAGSDDVRDSPALDVAGRLHERGAHVCCYDPKAAGSTARARPELQQGRSIEDACQDADLTLVLTDWPDFRSIDPVALIDTVRRPVVVDARLTLDPAKWTAAGWRFYALGRGRPW